MEYTLDRFVREAREAIIATQLAGAEHIELVAPKPNIPADLAFPTFKAARERQIAPPQLANELAQAIQPAPSALMGGGSGCWTVLEFQHQHDQLCGECARRCPPLG